MSNLLLWSVYEMTSKNALQEIKFRGRLRKFAIENEINLLVENDEKDINCVRFAVLKENDVADRNQIGVFIQKNLDPTATLDSLGLYFNPVLSKMQVNDENRYSV